MPAEKAAPDESTVGPMVVQQTEGGTVIDLKTRSDFWQSKMEALYSQYNPQKILEVPQLLLQYEGREALLYCMICSRYGLDPDIAIQDSDALAVLAEVSEDDGLAE